MSVKSKCSGVWQPETATTNPIGLHDPMSRTANQHMTPPLPTIPTDDRSHSRWYDVDPSEWLIHGLCTQRLATSLRAVSSIEDSCVRTN
jgi:hypothetical protein